MLGQCSFYVTHGPLISKMDSCCLEVCSTGEKLSRHVADFTLRGIGCSEEIISESINEVFGKNCEL